MATEEGWLTVADGTKLYTKTWKSEGPSKAHLAFIHGFSDHCNFYGELFPSLAAQGISVHALDQRGWGRSVQQTAQRGLTGPTTQVMADISAFVQDVLRRVDASPLFLMGHSMGGQEVLYYTATGPAEVVGRLRGVLAEAPFIALHPASKPLPGVVTLGRLAGRLLPRMQMVQKLDPRKISRDVAVVKQFEADELCHDTGTLEGLAGMLDRARELDEGVVRVTEGRGEGGKVRIWIGHGTEDGICHYDASKRWLDGTQVEDKQFKSYEGWYHKLHDEPGSDKQTFARDVARWILDRSEDEAAKAKL